MGEFELYSKLFSLLLLLQKIGIQREVLLNNVSYNDRDLLQKRLGDNLIFKYKMRKWIDKRIKNS